MLSCPWTVWNTGLSRLSDDKKQLRRFCVPKLCPPRSRKKFFENILHFLHHIEKMVINKGYFGCRIGCRMRCRIALQGVGTPRSYREIDKITAEKGMNSCQKHKETARHWKVFLVGTFCPLCPCFCSCRAHFAAVDQPRAMTSSSSSSLGCPGLRACWAFSPLLKRLSATSEHLRMLGLQPAPCTFVSYKWTLAKPEYLIIFLHLANQRCLCLWPLLVSFSVQAIWYWSFSQLVLEYLLAETAAEANILITP